MPSQVRRREDDAAVGDEFPGTSVPISDSPDRKKAKSHDSDVSLSNDAVTQEMGTPLTAQNRPFNALTVGPTHLIHRPQYVRLLEQSLCDLGFHEVAENLEKASGVTRVTPAAVSFERAVMDGRWNDAIDQIKVANTHRVAMAEVRDSAVDDDLLPAFAETTLLCLEALYEDQIRGGDSEAALLTLQTRMAPLFNLPGTPRYEIRQAARKEKGLAPLDSNFLGGGARLHSLAALLLFHSDDADDVEMTLSGSYARKFIDATPGTVVRCAEEELVAKAERDRKNKAKQEKKRQQDGGRYHPPNARCPISGKSLKDIEDPVEDDKGYVYERQPMELYIKQHTRRTRETAVDCLQSGTTHKVSLASLKPATKLLRARKVAEEECEAERKADVRFTGGSEMLRRATAHTEGGEASDGFYGSERPSGAWGPTVTMRSTQRRSDEGNVDLTTQDSDSPLGDGRVLTEIENAHEPTWFSANYTPAAKPPKNTEEGAESDDDFQIETQRNVLILRRARLTAPPMFLPPVGRLETLVEQALVQQTKKCVMHNAHAKPASLYRDYVCGEEQPLISSSDSEEEEEEEEEAEEEE